MENIRASYICREVFNLFIENNGFQGHDVNSHKNQNLVLTEKSLSEEFTIIIIGTMLN